MVAGQKVKSVGGSHLMGTRHRVELRGVQREALLKPAYLVLYDNRQAEAGRGHPQAQLSSSSCQRSPLAGLSTSFATQQPSSGDPSSSAFGTTAIQTVAVLVNVTVL